MRVPRKAAEFRAEAASIGRRARAELLDLSDAGWPPAADYDAIHADAVQAAHAVNQAIAIEERTAAPIQQILDAAERLRQLQATTPRCEYQRVVDAVDKDGNKGFAVGAMCGGKLKPVKRHQLLVGGECTSCGRFYPLPPDPASRIPEPEPAAAPEPEAVA